VNGRLILGTIGVNSCNHPRVNTSNGSDDANNRNVTRSKRVKRAISFVGKRKKNSKYIQTGQKST
jgi:hypothetical protein